MGSRLAVLIGIVVAGCFQVPATAAAPADMAERLSRLDVNVARAADIHAIKTLQRAYGYYLDKGMWADLADLFTEDAVANYPAGVYEGRKSIRRHLYENVGRGEMGLLGLGDGRLYNHMNIQPVVHLGPDGETAEGRWRAFAMFGRHGGGAIWAEGVYEIDYAKVEGVWKIDRLTYHSGFGAPYATGWVPPKEGGGGGRPPLSHPPDNERDMDCGGFPEPCVAPFHYDNPGTSDDGHVWTLPDDIEDTGTGAVDARLGVLLDRARRLRDAQKIENLQRIYGYYTDRAMWDQAADLFADDATIELGQRGVYAGQDRIRQFLKTLGPDGLTDGWLNNHIQLQPIVHVAADGKTARARSRELAMTGVYEGEGYWSAGIYENRYVKEDGVWKIQSIHFYPTFVTEYDQGWGRSALPVPGIDPEFPPDRKPTETYETYPQAYVPPFHYRNPVTGAPPQYPEEGRPSDAAIEAALMPAGETVPAPAAADIDAALAEAEETVARVKDYHELENLEHAYGYYLDKFLWHDLADLFAADGSMELAQRGVYQGRERVREFLIQVFGRGEVGPREGVLANHMKLQPVIHIAEDGKTARIRARLFQQMSLGGGASLGGGIYENVAVKEDGVWKFKTVHAYNTFTADYDGGWTHSPGRRLPGMSEDFPPDAPPTTAFRMFPKVSPIPYHYHNPVSGRKVLPALYGRRESKESMNEETTITRKPDDMPAEIASKLREIGAQIAPEETAELYIPLQTTEPYFGVAVQRDLSYGPAERNILDVFTSPDPGAGKPVMVFVHGGGFVRGAKRLEGMPFYDNVALWALGEGMVGVTVNYRLAPDHQWPSGIEDIRAVVDWLKANIAKYGGDPGKIFLWGHSAGAAHVGDYLAAEARAERTPGIAGAVLTSGFYELGDDVSPWSAYYGEDVSRYPERSALPALAESPVPVLANDAELDPDLFKEETQKLVNARMAAGQPVRYVHLSDHSHISETYAVGTADRSLTDPVKTFVREITGAAE